MFKCMRGARANISYFTNFEIHMKSGGVGQGCGRVGQGYGGAGQAQIKKEKGEKSREQFD